MKTNTAEQQGYDFAKGAVRYIAEIALAILILSFVIRMLVNAWSLGTDSTDVNGWERSGLKLHRDAATGIEYLSTAGGGIIARQKAAAER